MIEGKDFEGGGFDLLQVIIPKSSWRNIVKPTKTVRIAALLANIPVRNISTSELQCWAQGSATRSQNKVN
jgi:hypothetical protein